MLLSVAEGSVNDEYKGDSFFPEEDAFGQGQEIFGRCLGSQAGHSIPTFLSWSRANCSSKEQAFKTWMHSTFLTSR
ncbi:hypothetical protein OIU76_014230 [Salix suchowensis]|nr:hypothetical protein OIU76_014230 [Salix suchowensis]